MKGLKHLLALCAAMSGLPAWAGVDVDSYARKDKFDQIKISPTGEYFAASVPLEDRTVLAIMRRSDNKFMGVMRMWQNSHVAAFHWATPRRVLVSVAEKDGELERPQFTGELFAMDADGTKAEALVGYRVDDGGAGTLIKPKEGNDRLWAFPVDMPPTEGKQVLVSVQPYSADPYSTAELLDLYTGRRNKVATAPVRNAEFQVDNQGVVRFVTGSNSDNVRKLYYRSGNDAKWELLSQEHDGRFEFPVGFSEDDRIAFLQVEKAEGPDAIVALDLATRERKTVLQDDDVDPGEIIYRNGTRIPEGAYFMDGKLRAAFLDEGSAQAKLHRSLEAAFPDQSVVITSQTSDGRLALVKVSSDRNPGDFYLFDTVAKKASYLLARRDWIDPEAQGLVQPVQLQARDGMALHGYLAVPHGSSGKGLPLVVMPHGGPYGIRDEWAFDEQVQVLAAAGYAVLQVNYRGSSGYGRAFQAAGAREWGRKMQDDVTDATRWAAAQGIADGNRVCICGASYGGYAALMGVAKEAGLYRCAVGYVGIYDLPKMQADDARESRRFGNWSAEWVGDRESLGTVSPNRLAERINVPVLLVAGGEDKVAPIEHSRLMERALREAGKPVETFYLDTEGHGFYKEEHRREFYARLLAFLSRYLGGEVAAAAPPVPGKTGK
jgi:dipeptidyl aminopeptidase/acylaminoacyl peptidase